MASHVCVHVEPRAGLPTGEAGCSRPPAEAGPHVCGFLAVSRGMNWDPEPGRGLSLTWSPPAPGWCWKPFSFCPSPTGKTELAVFTKNFRKSSKHPGKKASQKPEPPKPPGRPKNYSTYNQE